jgi:luciferase family oxidoreductase group 1
MTALSVLDLVPVAEGASTADALRNALDLARHAELWGYRRYWVAEHHGLPGVAAAATAVAICHVAAGTATIRVGAGGIMLPNHAPLVIAEQFGTLESLFPGRIDLAVGRAAGADPRTTRALRRAFSAADNFPQDVLELQGLLGPPEPGQAVLAVPGMGTEVPLWILGSGLYGAELAAALGLPYAFAAHLAPARLDEALRVYRARFEPSRQLDRPCVAVGVNVVAADSEAAARFLLTSLQLGYTNLLRNHRARLPAPVACIDPLWSVAEQAQVGAMLECSAVGTGAAVAASLAALAGRTGADELLVISMIHDHAARLRSYEIVAAAMQGAARASARCNGGPRLT